jgi:indole-3-glycerol phosphate synthase
VASTRARLGETKARVTTEALEQRVASVEPPRGFRRALSGDGVALIAEIKRVSPARGPLNVNLNASELAAAYRRGGAAAISVVTEPDHFEGTMDDLAAARSAELPVLRKDFVIDDFQVLESRAVGADALLLIVRVVGAGLEPLVKATRALGMDAVVEVHDEDELDMAVGSGADLVGVNHRDLSTFEVDPERTARLAGRVPDGVTLVALSGVATRAEVERLGRAGAAAVLVGESLVTAADPAAKLEELAGGTGAPG